MNLTEDLKKQIRDMSYESMLSKWRFSPIGDPMFQGESGQYFSEIMKQKRAEPNGQDRHVRASKSLGW